MALEAIIELDNHLLKCRCCLKEFEIDDTQIKITKIVECRFTEVTQLVLKTTDNYSNVICELCNNQLRSFSAFRKDLQFKQTSLYQFVEGITDDPSQFDELVKDETIEDDEIQENMKIKTEQDDPDYSLLVSTEYLDAFQEGSEEESYTKFPAEDYYESSVNKQHVRKYTKSGSVKKNYKRALCGLCGNSYYKDQLQRHIDKVHFKVKRFFCDICGFGSFLRCNLSSHMSKHIAREYREQIRCTLCESTFTRHESLKNHMKTEHEEPVMLKCFCGKEFNLRHKLTTHIKRTHNNIRDHACIFCDRRFFTPKELRVHNLKAHTPGYVETTVHYCDVCGKRYSSSKSLRTHMKHHQEPEYKCNFDGCNKGFISKLLLNNHEKIHIGQRDFQCDQCEKSFFSSNHLRRHIAVSHEKVRVNCFIDGCRFAVGRKDYLRNHILTHRELPEDKKHHYLKVIREMKF